MRLDWPLGIVTHTAKALFGDGPTVLRSALTRLRPRGSPWNSRTLCVTGAQTSQAPKAEQAVVSHQEAEPPNARRLADESFLRDFRSARDG